MLEDTKITQHAPYGNELVGHVTIEGVHYFGRPNFSKTKNNFGDEKREFTVRIPENCVSEMRELGWNVKETMPKDAEGNPDPDADTIFHLNVAVDMHLAEILLKSGDQREYLNENTVPLLDRGSFESIDIEIRGWEYNPKVAPGKLSARLVKLVAVRRPSLLGDKHGM